MPHHSFDAMARSEAKLIYFGPALPEGRFSRADSVAGNRIP